MGNRRQRESAPTPERPDRAPVQRQAEPTPAASPLMNLQQSAGNRAVQRLVQRDEWDLDQLPQRGRSATIDASSSLREGEVTPHAERAAYVSAQGKKLQTALAAEKAQKASGAGWEDRQAAFAASPGAALAPARLQSKTAALVMDSRRLRSEAEHGPSEESRVLAEQAAKKAQAGGAAAPASPVAARPGGPDLAAAASAEGDASKLGIGATATGGVLESAVGGVGGFIGGNVSGATSGPDNKLTSQGLRDTGATGLTGGVGGMVASGLKFGQASELDAQAAALRGGNAAQTATADMLEGQASSARVDGGLGMVGGLSSAVEGGSRLAAAAGSAGGAVATDVMSKVTPGLGVLTGMASTARDLSNWSDQSDRRDNGEIAIGQHLKRTGGKGTAALDMASQLVDAKDRQATRSAASGVGNALSTGANMAAIIPGGQAVGGVLAGGAAVWKAGQAVGETVVDERQARDVQATRQKAAAGDIEAIERLAQIDPAIAQYAPSAAMRDQQDYAHESALLSGTVKATTGLSDAAVRSGASNPGALAQAISTDTGQSTEQATIGQKMSAGWAGFKKKVGMGPTAAAPKGPDAGISGPIPHGETPSADASERGFAQIQDEAMAATQAKVAARYGATTPAGPKPPAVRP